MVGKNIFPNYFQKRSLLQYGPYFVYVIRYKRMLRNRNQYSVRGTNLVMVTPNIK